MSQKKLADAIIEKDESKIAQELSETVKVNRRIFCLSFSSFLVFLDAYLWSLVNSTFLVYFVIWVESCVGFVICI